MKTVMKTLINLLKISKRISANNSKMLKKNGGKSEGIKLQNDI